MQSALQQVARQQKREEGLGEDLKPTLQNWKMPGSCTKTQTRPQLKFVKLQALVEERFLPMSQQSGMSWTKLEIR